MSEVMWCSDVGWTDVIYVKWFYFEVKLKWFEVEVKFKWSKVEVKLKWSWSEVKLKWSWSWSEVEVEVKLKWSEVEVKLKWNEVEVKGSELIQVLRINIKYKFTQNEDQEIRNEYGWSRALDDGDDDYDDDDSFNIAS
jgi:hypothetical protein